MRNRTLVVVLAMLICLAFSMMAVAAPAKPKKAAPVKAAAKVAKPAAFNYAALLDKLWASPDSTVVATVDGAAITKGELVRASWFWSASTTLEELIGYKMIVQAAKKQGVTLSAAELKAKEAEAVKQSQSKSIEDLCNKFKVSHDRFLLTIRRSALVDKAAKKAIKVTDAELAEYIKGRHILIRFPGNETDLTKRDAAAKTKIDEVLAKLKAGEDFAKLADEYTQDNNIGPDGKKKGGELGWFTHGTMVEAFDKAAYALKAGEFTTEPVKTEYGYHLIKIDVLGKDAKGEQKEEAIQAIQEKRLQTEMQSWYTKAQAGSKIVNKLAEPAPKEPAPVMRPQPPPRPAVRPTTPPPTPAPDTNPDTTAPAPDTTPPPPPGPSN